MRSDARAALDVFDPDSAPSVEHDPGGERVGLDRQRLAPQRRLQIGDRGAAPPAVADCRLPAAETFLLGAVVILGCSVAGGQPGRREGF